MFNKPFRSHYTGGLRTAALALAAAGLAVGCAPPAYQTHAAPATHPATDSTDSTDSTACLQDPLLDSNNLAKALIQDPGDPGALFFEGLRQELKGDLAEAREHYSAVADGQRDQTFDWACGAFDYSQASLKNSALDRLVAIGLAQGGAQPQADPKAVASVTPLRPQPPRAQLADAGLDGVSPLRSEAPPEIAAEGLPPVRGDAQGARALGLPRPGSIATPLGVSADQEASMNPAAPEPEAVAVAAPPPAPEARTPAPAGPEYSANFASYSSEDRAHEYRKDLLERFDAKLAPLETFVHMVDLGDRGLFYRVGARGFQNRDEVLAFCSRLGKQDCIPMVLK